MSGLQDDVHEKDRKLDADLKGKLDFFIWHQRFRRSYKAWSDASIDLKPPFLLTGEPLATAESWLLLHPGKFTDGERRYIMRGLAQSTQRAVCQEVEDVEEEKGRSHRGYIPLVAAVLIVAVIALPRFIQSSLAPSSNREVAVEPVAAPQDTAQADAAAPQPQRQASENGAADMAARDGNSSGDGPANNVPAVSPSLPSGPQIRRLTTLSHERLASGDRRSSLQIAAEAAHRVAALPPGKVRDENALSSITALFRGHAVSRQASPPLAATAAARAALFCEGGSVMISATDAGALQAVDLGATAALSPRPIAAQADPRTLLSGSGIDRACTRVVMPGDDDAAEIWSLSTGRRLARLEGHEHDLVTAGFSPDGLSIITTSQDKTARIWDAASGRQRMVLRGHDGSVLAAAFSADGRLIATASSDRTARIWDSATGREIATLRGHANAVAGAAFSPDGSRVLTHSVDGSARVVRIDVAAGQGVPILDAVLYAPGRVLMSAQFNRDGSRVIGLADDGAVLVFDATGGKALFQLSGPALHVREVVTSRDSDLLIVTGWEGVATLVDAGSGHPVATLTDHGQRAVSAAFTNGGREASVVLADGKVVMAPAFSSLGDAMSAAGSSSAHDCLSDETWLALGVGSRLLGCDGAARYEARWLATAEPLSPEVRRVEPKPIELSLSVEEDQ